MNKIFFLITCFLLINEANAQDPQLFDNNWYIEKVVIGAIEYLPPNSDCSNLGEVFFLAENFLAGNPCCESECATAIDYGTLDNFNLSGKVGCLLDTGCAPEVWDFTEMHFRVFFNENQTDFFNPYTYEIINDNNNLQLIVTNGIGSSATYNNILLSNFSVEKTNISFYPNPVSNTLSIQAQQSIIQVRIFGLHGQRLLTFKSSFDNLNVAALPTGVYFLEIVTDMGKIIKKLFKN